MYFTKISIKKRKCLPNIKIEAKSILQLSPTPYYRMPSVGSEAVVDSVQLTASLRIKKYLQYF